MSKSQRDITQTTRIEQSYHRPTERREKHSKQTNGEATKLLTADEGCDTTHTATKACHLQAAPKPWRLTLAQGRTGHGLAGSKGQEEVHADAKDERLEAPSPPHTRNTRSLSVSKGKRSGATSADAWCVTARRR